MHRPLRRMHPSAATGNSTAAAGEVAGLRGADTGMSPGQSGRRLSRPLVSVSGAKLRSDVRGAPGGQAASDGPQSMPSDWPM